MQLVRTTVAPVGSDRASGLVVRLSRKWQREDRVISGFAVAVAVCSALVALWSFVQSARNKLPDNPLLIALAVLEVLLITQLVIGVVLLAGGERPGSMATYLAYLIGCLVVLPIGAFWALAERSRSSTAVLGIACLAIPVMVLRLNEVWSGASA
jgi:4-amino-4-deoxy-L-arabinose transferase-like glycosyltransferase